MTSRDSAARSRRWFLFSLPAAACFAAENTGKGRILPSVVKRYPDPATEFPISRLTDPAHTSLLPAGRSIARHGGFLLYASDMTGRFEAYRLDLKNGQSRQLTECEDLDPASVTLLSGDRAFCFLDGKSLVNCNLASFKTHEIYRIPEGFERGHGLGVAEDAQYAAVVEKGSSYRLMLVHMIDGTATKLVECDEEIRDPLPRPRRASILYRRAAGIWLANYDAQQNYRLHLADGETGPAQWSPDGRTMLYLNYPAEPHKLHTLREFTPDSNEDKLIASTTQFVGFGLNADASVFVGASGSKASPYVLLLVRAVRRELTMAEHRASNAQMVAPIFAPNSQRIFFVSDRDGKPAIYTMSVEKFVEETDSPAAPQG